jgi:superfamily I DNA and/or RNA helicase
MIIDLSHRGDKKMFITRDVIDVEQRSGMYYTKFANQMHTYTYRKERLLVLKEPVKVNLNGCGLYIKKKRISDASDIYKFVDGNNSFWHIVFKSGSYIDVDGRDVCLSQMPITLENSNTWDYLNQVAANCGLQLHSKDDEDDVNLLQLQYKLVDIYRNDVPLSQYLGAKKKLKTYMLPKDIIYPFGCNASQKKAVENALTNQMSIIQGPPGTGKTQTILNIIANLLIQDKTILVVSNNNSAVDNIKDKLSANNICLDFIVAKLGSSDNKNQFIENQKNYPYMDNWINIKENVLLRQIGNALNIVSKGFPIQNKLAVLRLELSSLETEQKYNKVLINTIGNKYHWLCKKRSARLMLLLHKLNDMFEKEKPLDLMSRIKLTLSFGFKTWTLLKLSPKYIIDYLETAYYVSRERELSMEIEKLLNFLQTNDIDNYLLELSNKSLLYLKSFIARKYRNKKRIIFEKKNIKYHSEEFLQEYPVVLSTTYSSKNNISKDMVFDYVIMDEASQVDISTGALALSCAENAVIVGDDKQLPNVLDGNTRAVLNDMETSLGISDKYRITTHNFLESCMAVFKNSPSTLLREHYRCHPKIIDFCNKMFYDNELIIMTKDDKRDDVIKVIRTVKGNHARDHINQREIDVINKEVMPNIKSNQSLGIITPYRDQAAEINIQLKTNIASTVHKYQGRECNCILISMVDNEPTRFSDDPNLLNVAISRAKSELRVVATGNDIPGNTILSKLIGYVSYNNFEIQNSGLYSVFDILYKQYAELRLRYEGKTKSTTGQLSEDIIFNALVNTLNRLDVKNIEILCHYPLARLISDKHILNEEQRSFVESLFSHVDFLLYNNISKRPLLSIEVDGWKYHNTIVQKHRDMLKDEILDKYGLKPLRLSTNEIVTEETLKSILINKIG